MGSTKTLEGKKVLVVEDDREVLESLKLLFEEKKIRMIHTEYALSATSIAEKEFPDLCIFDVMLPDGSGVNLYVEFKKHPVLSVIPIVFLTAVNDYELGEPWTPERISLEYNVPPPQGFLEKPFLPDELIRLLEKILFSRPDY
ncbi:MAG: response regulator [Candidatus Hydrogenedentes bacterium]|nr:response regulator [Candidatus Hydrogenedentota bacterium]